MAGKNHEAWDLNLPSANSLHKIILVPFLFILRQMLRFSLDRVSVRWLEKIMRPGI